MNLIRAEDTKFGAKFGNNLLVRPRIEAEPQNHMVQFYHGQAHLIESVTLFLQSGLSHQEGIVMILRPDNWIGIQNFLQKSGVEISAALESGQLVILNAHECLGQFMVNDLPERELFCNLIGKTLKGLSQKFSGIRAYGEMVDILWEQGNLQGTIGLEKLWNEISETHSFSLLCGYGMHNFSRDVDGIAFQSVCCSHTHVLPAEDYLLSNHEDANLRVIAELQQKTKALQVEVAERRSIEARLLRSQQELVKAKEEADVANQTKSRFLANMCHEIRTPLGAVLGFTELMGHPEHSEDEKKLFLETILRNGQHLTHIVNEILDLSKIEAGKFEIEEIDFSLASLIDDLSVLLLLRAREKGLTLESVIEEGVPEMLKTDLTRLKQILVNLLGNAIKFTSQGKIHLRVRTVSSTDGHRLEFLVEDSGIGISPDQQKNLFQAFSQADNSTTRKYGGTGLGLFLSQKFATALGGRLQLHSSLPNEGSVFLLSLPL